MPAVTTYLDLSDLMAAAEAFLGHPPQVRDVGLLDSALARPASSMYGVEAYPDLHEKAAALLLSLNHNHGLVDGNKRLAWVATRLFYLVDGHDLRMDHDAAYKLVMGIAAGAIDDVKEVADQLRANITRTKPGPLATGGPDSAD